MLSPSKERLKQVVKPDIGDLLDALKEDIFSSLNKVQVGYIEDFDGTTQTASIRIAVKQITDTSLTGVETLEERSILLECPVFVYSGGGQYISMPISRGDSCIVLFNDRDIDNWYANGGVQRPNTKRAHDLSDAFALVGVKNTKQFISDYLTNGIRLFVNNGTKIELIDGAINSTTALFTQNGNMAITGGVAIGGVITAISGGSDNLDVDADLTQAPGRVLKAGNGDTGTFTAGTKTITVEDGIITSIV